MLETTTLDDEDEQYEETLDSEEKMRLAGVIRRMKLQIWAGTISGLIIATAIGAAFIAIVSSESRPTYKATGS